MASPPELSIEKLKQACAQPRFNLVEEPWIPVTRDGAPEEVGLATLFRDAHLLAGPFADTDIERWAIRFLLIALTQDMLGSARATTSPTCFDPDAVEAYFAAARERLWLIHPAHPFMQQAELLDRSSRKLDTGEVVVATNSVKTLSVKLGAGSKPTWWDHVSDCDETGGWFSYSLAEAARFVVTRSLFSEPGNEQWLDGAGGGNTLGGLYCYVGGNVGMLLTARQAPTLFDTLRANIYRDEDATTDSLPTADLTSTAGMDRRVDDLSTLEMALWSAKATLLLPEADSNRVTYLLRGSRDKVSAVTDAATAADAKERRKQLAKLIRMRSPHTTTKLNDKGETVFEWSDQSRAVWRALDALSTTFAPRAQAGNNPSLIPSEYRAWSSIESHVETLGCSYSGPAATSVLSGWANSYISDDLITEQETVLALAEHLEKGGIFEECERALRSSVRLASLPRRDVAGKLKVDWSGDDPPVLRTALSRYWADAETLAGDLAAVFTQTGVSTTPPDWRSQVKDAARVSAEEAFITVERSDPSRLLIVAEARSRFSNKLREIS